MANKNLDTESIPSESVEISETPVKRTQISLARANKLRNAIGKEIQKICSNMETTAWSKVTAFPNESKERILEKVQARKDEFRNEALEMGYLTRIHSNLKQAIQEANVHSGIAKIMTEIDRTTSIITLYDRIFRAGPYSRTLEVQDPDQIAYQIRKNKELELPGSAGAQLRSPSTFEVPLYEKDELEAEIAGIASLEKARTDLEEQRNALNYSTTIGLDPGIVEYLEDRKLL